MFGCLADPVARADHHVEPARRVVDPCEIVTDRVRPPLLALTLRSRDHHSTRCNDRAFVPWHVWHVPRLPDDSITPPLRIDDEIEVGSINSQRDIRPIKIDDDDLGLIDDTGDPSTIA